MTKDSHMRTLYAILVAPTLLLLVAGSATAGVRNYYQVSAAVSVDGRTVMHPHAIIEANHPARIEVGGSSADAYRIDFTVTPGNGAHASDQARIEVSFYTKVSGNWTLRSQPSLAVWLGKQAHVEMPFHDGATSSQVAAVDLTVARETPKALRKRFGGAIPAARVGAGQASSVATAVPFADSATDTVTPLLRRSNCCSAACKDGSGSTMKCCGALSCSACGTSCSP